MRCFIVVLIASAAIGCAQVSGSNKSEANRDIAPQEKAAVLCKLESVTWKPESAELSWVVSIRDISAGADGAVVQEKYTIQVENAVMNFKGEDRRFSEDEARQVGKLMDMISAYTVESTLWWAKGLGEKLDGNESAPTEHKDRNKGTDDRPKSVPILLKLH